MTLQIFTFAGTGDDAEQAADDASGKAAEWLAVHQWRTSDGQPSYIMTSALTTVEGESGRWFAYVLTFYGPTDETPPLPSWEVGFTGKTERLR